MFTHRFNYQSDHSEGGTWFGEYGVSFCDWSWDGGKKILTVRRGWRGKQVSLSSVDVARLGPQELGKRLSEAALEAAQRT